MLWGLIGKSSKASSPDKFRIKVITLKDGTKKYYPQYKEDVLSTSWLNILLLQNTNYILIDLSNYELINGNNSLADEESSRNLIERYKRQLEIERATQFESEEIINL